MLDEVDWFDIKKRKPYLEQKILIFRQGYGVKGNYYSSYDLAVYVKLPGDRRKKAFIQALGYEAKPDRNWDWWVYDNVTHWMPIPEPPEVIERIKNEQDA